MTRLADIGPLYEPVRGLWAAKNQIRQIELRTKPAQEVIKAFHRCGAATDVLGRELTTEREVQRKPYWSCDTKRLKKDRPADHERGRALKRYHSIKTSPLTPEVYDYGTILAPLPKDWNTYGDLIAAGFNVADAYTIKTTWFESLKNWKKYRNDCQAAIETALAYYANQGWWDGTPRTFDDGWTFGARALQFQSEYARTVLPHWVVGQYFKQVSPAPSVTVYVINPDKLDDAGRPEILDDTAEDETDGE
jgi:hypothetical protein